MAVSKYSLYIIALIGGLTLLGLTESSSASGKNAVDPKLVKVVDTIKKQANDYSVLKNAGSLSQSLTLFQEVPFLENVNDIFSLSYGDNAEDFLSATNEFAAQSKQSSTTQDDHISSMLLDYAQVLSRGASANQKQALLNQYFEDDDWFTAYAALTISSYEYSETRDRSEALRRAQTAFEIIPAGNETISKYARIHVTLLIARLHNYQVNKDLAMAATLEYLNMTEDNFDPENALDLLNNLLYSHAIWRDHSAQAYLTENILDLESTLGSNVPGLTELRVAKSKNDSMDYAGALPYALEAIEKTEHESIRRQALQNKAIALAGMGRNFEAKKIIARLGGDFDPVRILENSDSGDILHYGMLTAFHNGQRDLAIQIMNKRLDFGSEKILTATTRDTASMLAALENSRERQLERAAAAKRESMLQAITIRKQKNLNRVLIALSAFLSLAVGAAVMFARYRDRISKELAIKTKQAESAEKLKTEFLGLVSHELRTPLNGIIGLSDLLANHYKDPDIRQKSSVILDSGHRLLAVVEAMTDMARIDAGRMEVVFVEADIPGILTPVVETARVKAANKNIEFTSHIDPALETHVTDGERLSQCVEYLLSNAVKFTDTGRVHVHVTAIQDDTGAVKGLQTTVADTGVGMTELVQSRLFTPFMQADQSMTRSFEGAGLSLAITRALARMMGGDVTVNSRAGRGSEFVMSIQFGEVTDAVMPKREVEKIDIDPLEADGEASINMGLIDLMKPKSGAATAPLHDVEMAQEAGEGSLDGLRVLLVDDMESNRAIIRLLLEMEGCICFEAEDGTDALRQLSDGPMDVVMMDIFMPKMDGIEATRRIRSLETAYADIPIIALTADNAAETNASCMAAGVDIFLTKPVKANELSQALSFIVSKPNTRRLLSSRAL